MKKRLLVLALMIAALLCLPSAPAKKHGAFSASAAASCGVASQEACWENGGYWDFECCVCSDPSVVQACTSMGGYWDYCYRTCT